MSSLSVFLTVDVEMWPPTWDADLPTHHDAFRRYIHGVGKPAEFGLPYQLQVLADHGLKGIFFVEPLFASILGKSALEEIVGMIRQARQDLQLHLHPEWLGRAGHPELPGPYRLALRHLPLAEQTRLISLGRRWLEEAGASDIRSFRAGSFAANRDTLLSLAANGVGIDFSQCMASHYGPIDPLIPEDISMTEEGVAEVPLTTYTDFLGRRRPLQVGSSGSAEVRSLLYSCLAQGRRTATFLSHSAELLDDARSAKDRIAHRRFLELCRFLDRRRAEFGTATTEDVAHLCPVTTPDGPAALTVPMVAAFRRYTEQVIRRCL